jgi:hypothetical protein
LFKLEDWLKCLASTKPWIQAPVLEKRKKQKTPKACLLWWGATEVTL